MNLKLKTAPLEMAYLDTSIPNFYFDEREKFSHYREVTREWFEKKGETFFICSSVVVLNELKAGDYPHKSEAISFMERIGLLPINEQVMEVARYYIDHYLAPREDIEEFRGDAIHLALCAYYRVDYLLTWNQKHLANINKLKQLRIMNARLRLETPAVITPEQLLI